MSNMSYCRFQNTAGDFEDCVEHLRSLDPNDRHPNTDAERRARERLVVSAARLLQELGIDDVYDEVELEQRIARLNDEFDPDTTDD